MKFADLDLNKAYTYADYLKWTFEERVELIKGKVFMNYTPNRNHQDISGCIHGVLYNFLKGKSSKVYAAPFDVRIPGKSIDDNDVITVLQPDLCVCAKAILDEKGCIGTPDIVIEILSPGNNTKELADKYEVYKDAGVKEYWVVSPQNENFLVYTLKEGDYVASRLMVAGHAVTSSVLPGFSLDLTDLFNSMD